MELASAMESDEYAYARRLVCAYFCMLTVGCGDRKCPKRHCRCNPSSKVLTPNDAALKSIEMATKTPVPLCCSLVDGGSRPALVEERPEVDEDEVTIEDDEAEKAELACSPRRRLSHAVEMDMALNLKDSTRVEQHERGDERSHDGRRTSLPKQKLLEAIRKSFPAMRPELEVSKKR